MNKHCSKFRKKKKGNLEQYQNQAECWGSICSAGAQLPVRCSIKQICSLSAFLCWQSEGIWVCWRGSGFGHTSVARLLLAPGQLLEAGQHLLTILYSLRWSLLHPADLARVVTAGIKTMHRWEASVKLWHCSINVHSVSVRWRDSIKTGLKKNAENYKFDRQREECMKEAKTGDTKLNKRWRFLDKMSRNKCYLLPRM